MAVENIVYIGTSLDGYIADRNDGLEWLEMVPNPHNQDLGFNDFMNNIDALVMGRNTFEKVLSFGIPWPYTKPVYVLSRTLKQIPEELTGKVQLIEGSPEEISAQMDGKGYKRIYIDGGKTIQSYLKEDMIDEMIITRLPVLLGGGASLFGDLPGHLEFSLESSTVLLDQMVCSTYKRKRD